MVLHGGYNFTLDYQTLFDKYDYIDLLDIVEIFVNSPYNTKIGWTEVKQLKFVEFEFLMMKIKEKINDEKEESEVEQVMNNKGDIPNDNIIGDINQLNRR